MLPERTLTREDYETGFSYGLHLVKNAMFWMGGVSASGGSVEWFRSLLSDKALSYEQISQLLSSQEPTPTGIIYIPNMTGSGALIGLKATYGKGHILKAVLEGTAYEMEMIRETAERVAGYSLNNISVVGGGAKNKHWLQIKADVSGTELQIPEQHESALLGAAMMAAVGAGTFESAVQAQAGMSKAELPLTIIPQWENHKSYKRLYGEKYKPLQAAIRKLTP
jgi:xylulokinase